MFIWVWFVFGRFFGAIICCEQENIPIEEVFENLRCSRDGLTTEAAEERLTIFGHNKLEEKKVLYLSLQLTFFPLVFTI